MSDRNVLLLSEGYIADDEEHDQKHDDNTSKEDNEAVFSDVSFVVNFDIEEDINEYKNDEHKDREDEGPSDDEKYINVQESYIRGCRRYGVAGPKTKRRAI